MGWFKKNEEPDEKRIFMVDDFSKEIKGHIQNIQSQIKELQLGLWIYKTICPQVEYEVLFREPGSWASNYDAKCKNLEAKGWHIKRVSDCGRYEIWMPLPKSSST